MYFIFLSVKVFSNVNSAAPIGCAINFRIFLCGLCLGVLTGNVVPEHFFTKNLENIMIFHRSKNASK